MKIAKTLAAIALGALALFAFGRFFLGQLGGSRGPEPAGIVDGPPPGYEVVERGVIPPAEAAAQLAALLGARRESPEPRQVAVRFDRAGGSVYWMADSRADRLEERSAGASGTRVQTIWPGHLQDRLRWAQAHGGDPAAPGLPPPERHNLYH